MHGSAEIVEGLLVVVVGAMREVEAGDVHASPEKLLDHGGRAGRGAEGADDLGLGDAAVVGELLEYSFYVYVGHSLKLEFD